MSTHHSHHTHHHGACHSHAAPSGTHAYRRLIAALLLVLIYAAVEAVGGYFSHSLALLSDAGHMMADGLALLIAAFAAWVALRPPSPKHSYGFGRAEILAAWFSSLLLLAIAAWIIVEAVARIHHPPATIHASGVIWIAGVGLVVNLLIAWILSDSEHNLNTRAALLHVLSDLLASFAALVSGAVIYATGWLLIDPVLSILIGVIIIISSLRLLRESVLILMEGVPAHINSSQVESLMLGCEGVKGLHDLHIWTLASGKVALSAHVDIHDLGQWRGILSTLKKELDTHFKIKHVTLQPEAEIMDCKPCGSA